MSGLIVLMERLKVEAVKEANALNPTRKGVRTEIHSGDSSRTLYYKLLECLNEGDGDSSYAYADAIRKKHGATYIFRKLFELSFTNPNALFLNLSNRATYLCAAEPNRRAVKSNEVCLMYVINTLSKTMDTADAWQKYLHAADSFDQDIKHARDTYWNKSLTALQTLALDKRLPIPQRIIALQYLYGVELSDCTIKGEVLEHFKPYNGLPNLWFDTSLLLAKDNGHLQVLLQLGYSYLKIPPMIGLALTLKKAIDKNS